MLIFAVMFFLWHSEAAHSTDQGCSLTSRSRDVVSKRLGLVSRGNVGRSRSRLGLKIKCLGPIP